MAQASQLGSRAFADAHLPEDKRVLFLRRCNELRRGRPNQVIGWPDFLNEFLTYSDLADQDVLTPCRQCQAAIERGLVHGAAKVDRKLSVSVIAKIVAWHAGHDALQDWALHLMNRNGMCVSPRRLRTSLAEDIAITVARLVSHNFAQVGMRLTSMLRLGESNAMLLKILWGKRETVMMPLLESSLLSPIAAAASAAQEINQAELRASPWFDRRLIDQGATVSTTNPFFDAILKVVLLGIRNSQNDAQCIIQRCTVHTIVKATFQQPNRHDQYLRTLQRIVSAKHLCEKCPTHDDIGPVLCRIIDYARRMSWGIHAGYVHTFNKVMSVCWKPLIEVLHHPEGEHMSFNVCRAVSVLAAHPFATPRPQVVTMSHETWNKMLSVMPHACDRLMRDGSINGWGSNEMLNLFDTAAASGFFETDLPNRFRAATMLAARCQAPDRGLETLAQSHRGQMMWAFTVVVALFTADPSPTSWAIMLTDWANFLYGPRQQFRQRHEVPQSIKLYHLPWLSADQSVWNLLNAADEFLRHPRCSMTLMKCGIGMWHSQPRTLVPQMPTDVDAAFANNLPAAYKFRHQMLARSYTFMQACPAVTMGVDCGPYWMLGQKFCAAARTTWIGMCIRGVSHQHVAAPVAKRRKTECGQPVTLPTEVGWIVLNWMAFSCCAALRPSIKK